MHSTIRRSWTFRHRNSGYGTVDESEKLEYPSRDSIEDEFDERWMSHVDDSALVSSLTIPGTHDSAAYTYGLPFVATQKLSILQQLNTGVRYLDLRCGLRDDVVEMVHGPTILGQTLDQVLDTLYSWLDSHPTEALIVQIKQDREAERSNVHFSHAIFSQISAKSDHWRTTNTTPTLGELRGKIQLFRRFRGPNLRAYGIDVSSWKDNPPIPFTINTRHEVQLTIQDHYSFTQPTPLPGVLTVKGGDISGLLHRASDDVESAHWYLNFTSASEFTYLYQLPPKEIAVGGYWLFRWIDGLNPRLATFLKVQETRQRYGIVAMDFPEQGANDLIHVLIMANFKRDNLSPMWRRMLLWMTILLLMIFSLIIGYGLASIQRSVGFEQSAINADNRDLLMAQNLEM